MTLENKEGYLSVNGVDHWYRIAGVDSNKSPVIVLHGGPGGNVYNFEHSTGAKLESFYKIIYYDQRGCGRSERPQDQTEYSMEGLVDDLEVLRRKLGINRFTALGFSFGGELALEYALKYPQFIDKLILQAPAPIVAETDLIAEAQLRGFAEVGGKELAQRIALTIPKSLPGAEKIYSVWKLTNTSTIDKFLFHNAEACEINRRLQKKSGLRNSGHMMKALLAQDKPRSLMNRLGNIEQEVLVMIGKYDRNVGLKTCETIATSIPKSRLVNFDKSAHFVDLEEAEKYIQELRSFLG